MFWFKRILRSCLGLPTPLAPVPKPLLCWAMSVPACSFTYLLVNLNFFCFRDRVSLSSSGVLELIMYTRLASNSEMFLPLSPECSGWRRGPAWAALLLNCNYLVYICTPTRHDMTVNQKTACSWFSLSTLCFPRIKLKSSGLVVSTFPTNPSS